MKLETRITLFCLVGILGVVQFIVMTFIAMVFYTGGSKLDPGATGYDFFSNFFSDLGRVTSYNGQDNLVAMTIFTISLCVVGAGNIFFFIALPMAFSNHRVSHRLMIIASIFGFFYCTWTFVIAFVPDDKNNSLHVVLASLAYMSVGCAAFISAGAMWNMHSRSRAVTGIVALILVSLMIYTIFVLEPYTLTGFVIAVMSQKFLEYALCAWTIFLSWTAWQAYKTERQLPSIDER